DWRIDLDSVGLGLVEELLGSFWIIRENLDIGVPSERRWRHDGSCEKGAIGYERPEECLAIDRYVECAPDANVVQRFDAMINPEIDRFAIQVGKIGGWIGCIELCDRW